MPTLAGHPPGSAGVPPATLFLQAACRPGPLLCKARRTHRCRVRYHGARSYAGGTPALPGGSFFTSRSVSTARMVREIGAVHQVANEAQTHGKLAQGIGLEIFAVRAWPNAALMAVTTIKSTDSLEVESVRAGGVGTSLDGVEVRSVAAGSCLCSVGHPLGARASRPHLIPANSLPSKATPLQGAPNPPLRGSLPCIALPPRDVPHREHSGRNSLPSRRLQSDLTVDSHAWR